MSAHIRAATILDREDICSAYLCALPEGEDQLVATLAANLPDEATDPETIALVAEIGGRVAGHIAFSPVTADTSKNPKYYERFGFRREAAARFVPPYELKHPSGWQARVLHEAGSGNQAVSLSCVRSLRDPALC